MKYSYTDVKLSITEEKKKEDTLIGRYLYRPVANILAYFAVNARISANTISILSVIATFASCIAFLFPFGWGTVVGLVLLNIFPVLDCVDGTIARTLKGTSHYGEFFDAMGGYAMCAFPLIFLCMAAKFNGKLVEILPFDYLFLLYAAGAICSLFSKMIYQRYRVSTLETKGKAESTIYEDKKDSPIIKKVRHYIVRFDRYIGIGDGYAIILTVAYCTGWLAYVAILYSVYNILIALAILGVYCRKAAE